jgi:hypothetical protein
MVPGRAEVLPDLAEQHRTINEGLEQVVGFAAQQQVRRTLGNRLGVQRQQPPDLCASLGLAAQVDVAAQVVLHHIAYLVHARRVSACCSRRLAPCCAFLQRWVHPAVTLAALLLPLERRERVGHGRPLAELHLAHAAVHGRLVAVGPGPAGRAALDAQAGVFRLEGNVLARLQELGGTRVECHGYTARLLSEGGFYTFRRRFSTVPA